MTLTFIHERLSNAMWLFALIAGLWGLIAYLRNRGVESNYWGILLIGEILFAAQALLGVVLWFTGMRPARLVHILYGAVAVLTLPAFFAYNKGRDDRTAALGYGLLCLFLFGISLRAIGTGG